MLSALASCLLPIREPVKARRVIHEQLSLALFADIGTVEKNVHRAVEAVAVRNVGTVNPSLIAELFDGERQQFFVHLEAEINLSTLDVFFG